jgi:hypothetical protein
MKRLITVIAAVLITVSANAQITTFQKTYNSTAGSESGHAVAEAPEGYAFAGRTSGFGVGSDDGYLVRTDHAGNTIWSKSYGGANEDYFNSIGNTNDNGFILAGFTNSFVQLSDSGNIYLVKVDFQGTVLWSKSIGGSFGDVANCVRQTADQGFIICGSSQSFSSSNNRDLYLVKTDYLGNIQ